MDSRYLKYFIASHQPTSLSSPSNSTKSFRVFFGFSQQDRSCNYDYPEPKRARRKRPLSPDAEDRSNSQLQSKLTTSPEISEVMERNNILQLETNELKKRMELLENQLTMKTSENENLSRTNQVLSLRENKIKAKLSSKQRKKLSITSSSTAKDRPIKLQSSIKNASMKLQETVPSSIKTNHAVTTKAAK